MTNKEKYVILFLKVREHIMNKRIFWQMVNDGCEAWRFGVDPQGPRLQRTCNGIPVIWDIDMEGIGWIGFLSIKDRNCSLSGV